jgi:hypothetical protein
VTVEQEVAQLQQQYTDLLHAVQSGVKAEIEIQPKDDTNTASPKHLRVGVNSALIQNSSLATLLMRKGIITEVEYWRTQVELWQNEVADYENRLSQATGMKVTLQ